MGKFSRLDRWVAHALSHYDRERRVDAAAFLLYYSRRTNWLNHVVTGDEKWCLYANINRKRSWTDEDLQRKIHEILYCCVWWYSSVVLPHPPYSLYLSPSDCHFSYNSQGALKEKAKTQMVIWHCARQSF